MGVTPIVEHSPLDELYEKAGNVLFVDSFADVTPELLEENLPRFREIIDNRDGRAPEILTRAYWKKIIDNVRNEALERYKLRDSAPRKRCWGLESADI